MNVVLICNGIRIDWGVRLRLSRGKKSVSKRCLVFKDHVRMPQTDSFKIRQHVAPVPSRIAKLSPIIVVTLTTSIPQHCVQDAASADNSSLWDDPSVSIKISLGSRLKVPVPGSVDVSPNKDGDRDDLFVIVTVFKKTGVQSSTRNQV